MPFFDRISEGLGRINEALDNLGERLQPTPVIKATMMGPRAVGKTSIMASIFKIGRAHV